MKRKRRRGRRQEGEDMYLCKLPTILSASLANDARGGDEFIYSYLFYF